MRGRKVFVQDGNTERALRKFKKKIADQGKLQELHDRETYIKPTTARKRAKGAAKARWRKKLQKEQLPPKRY